MTGKVTLADGTPMMMPGDSVKVTVDLNGDVAMDKGLRFAVREGGKTVGWGVVTEILD